MWDLDIVAAIADGRNEFIVGDSMIDLDHQLVAAHAHATTRQPGAEVRHIAIILACLLIVAARAQGQFVAPVPQALGVGSVRAEDFRKEFERTLTPSGRESLVTELKNRAANKLATAGPVLDSARTRFCRKVDDRERSECLQSLAPTELAVALAHTDPKITVWHLRPRIPFGHSRGELARFMQRSGASAGLTSFAQFAANVSENEAFVVTSVVRGLAGRAIFAVDYAAVVTKSDESDNALREEVEDDKATLLRLVNNGGTLVMRAFAPVAAWSGATWSGTAGIDFNAGLLGEVGRTETLNGVGSVVAEWMNAIAIRDILGSERHDADILIGARAGYSRVGGRVIEGNAARGVAYGQFAIGLRKDGKMSLSALVSVAERRFESYVPKLMVNFTAIR